MSSLTGSCACGTVQFEVELPFITVGYCHCRRCRKRSGVPWSMNGMAPGGAFSVVAGADAIRTWRPENGLPKSFCAHCGGHVFSGEPARDGPVGVRLGAVDGDPGMEPRWRQWLESSPEWVEIPDDGLPRFMGARTID